MKLINHSRYWLSLEIHIKLFLLIRSLQYDMDLHQANNHVYDLSLFTPYNRYTYTIICKQLSSRSFTVSTIDRYKINSFLMLRMVDSAIYCAVSGGFCILLKNEGGHFAIKMIKVWGIWYVGKEQEWMVIVRGSIFVYV